MGRMVKIAVVVLVLGIVGYVGYDQMGKWYRRGVERALEQEREEWQERAAELEGKVVDLQKEIGQEKEATVPREKIAEVFGEETVAVMLEWRQMGCEELKRHIVSFFDYLDNKEYIKGYGYQEGTLKLFQHMVFQLSEKPPLVTGETRDVPTLMHNMAHFYRVLGKKPFALLKETIGKESELMESMMAVLYEWCASGKGCEDMNITCPSPKVLYEYAGFFLNTLAGRSYLLRRGSKMKVLTEYYSVLIVDRANEEMLNHYGIDIKPHLEVLYDEISNHRALIYKNWYLQELDKIKGKYEVS